MCIRDRTSGSETISHGLSSTPQFIIVKSAAQAYSWVVWHKDLTSAAYSLILNTTAAQSNGINAWNSTLPTSSVFTLGSAYANAGVSIAFCWHDVPGLQKFGSYVGNGNANGPVIETGFKPAIIWIKSIAGAEHWRIVDSARDPINPADAELYANSSGATTDIDLLDFLSDGFKIKVNYSGSNTNGHTYIYCAWAEAPSFNMYGASSNAR